ncbi:MAG: CYTH domain-containing protein [Lachnospiraceae bacterium]|nr:CYTH domain-containing protein [Lachnospiraceae bacterium]
MEIEKKYLVKQLPENLAQYEKWEIEQCYLCADPVVRLRKKNDEYILTYKSRNFLDKAILSEKMCVAEEVELPLTKEAYEHLKKKADGNSICKTRYLIPYKEKKIELDVFHGGREGFYLAEIEFDSVEEGKKFSPPSWFGEDVSGDYHYTNSYLSLH